MNSYIGEHERDELEQILRKLIGHGCEGRKVDFKRTLNIETKQDKAEFAKDLSSIANTDDPQVLNDFGYIILGADREKLVGAGPQLDDVDGLQAHLTNVIKDFVAPVPQFSVIRFHDKEVGNWGVIVIPPSIEQPHVLIRDGGAGVVRHEWWVRVGDTKERGGPQDYARFLAKAVRREVRPIEHHVQRLAGMIEGLRPSPSLESIIEALRDSKSSPVDPVDSEPSDRPASAVRKLLLKDHLRTEETLIAESMRLAEVMTENTEANPWIIGGKRPAELLTTLAYLEDQAFPLAEALATVARYDRENALTDVVQRAVRVISKEPQFSGSWTVGAKELRLYPLYICIFAATMIAANEERGNLIRMLLDCTFQGDNKSVPIIRSVDLLSGAANFFTAAMQESYIAPIHVRLKEAVAPRFLALLVGTPQKHAFFVTEFVLALEALKHRKAVRPSLFLYEFDAIRPLEDLLARRPRWLHELFANDLSDLLSMFDELAPHTVRYSRGWADGFYSGAVKAYEGKTR